MEMRTNEESYSFLESKESKEFCKNQYNVLFQVL